MRIFESKDEQLIVDMQNLEHRLEFVFVTGMPAVLSVPDVIKLIQVLESRM